ncbi:outer membrane beta-barrel protein [Poritiphilus flavus]|uniref:Outer membrane protein beta-barrel domain-containing protein n=1 Tax=Poritiphilus flavus TaxID=2697053 RepID=A0A6L9EBY6_9FLAO|nr:outer membrane beta-barrel protein [Poritiphilus flavus]NAS12058.1 hypothetical protein [Poritiphilus flavus]
MKKLIVLGVLGILGLSVKAQDSTSTAKDSWLIEANTGFGAGTGAHASNTGFGFYSSDGTTIWAIGVEGGYFMADNLALKLGLGYSSQEFDNDFFDTSAFTYKVGLKYYIVGTVPIQLDVTGGSIKDLDENPLWLGIQGAYAIFLADNLSLEPGLRYNLSMNEDFTDQGIFEFRIGFAIHL